MTDKPANYIAALRQAIDEGRQLTQERAVLDRKLARLRETVVTLLRLLEEDQPVRVDDLFQAHEIPDDNEIEESLTEAVSDVLKSREGFMNATEIKDGLIAIGFDVNRYSAPLPTITTTLARLDKSGDIVSRVVGGKTVYKWNTSNFKHSPLKYIGQRVTADDELRQRFAPPKKNFLREMAENLKEEGKPSGKLSDLRQPRKPRSGIGSLKKKN